MSATFRFWTVTLATLLATGLTLSLGNWQLHRAAEKLALQAAIDAQQQRPPLGNAELLSTADRPSLVHRQARLRGQWLAAQTVFLDNRQMGGKVGLFALTPLKLAGSDALLMVQRGWAPRNFLDRTQVPAIQTPGGEVEVLVRLAPPPSRLYEFQGTDNGVIRQNLDLVNFAQSARLPLLTDLSALELPAAGHAGAGPDGLARDWPVFRAAVDTHYGYAFQWFGLSALLVILYVWFQFLPFRRARRG